MAISNSIDSGQTLATTSSPTFTAVTSPAINAGSGADETITLGDAAGVNKLSIVDSAASEVAFVDSNGEAAFLASVTIGQDSVNTSFTISGVSTTAQLSVDAEGTDALAEAVIHRHNASSVYGAYTVLMRSRGTDASPVVVQDGDGLGTLFFGGYDGSAWSLGGMIQCDVDGTPGVNDMPSTMVFGTTADGANFPTTAMTIDAAQDISIPAGDLTVTRSESGSDVQAAVYNTSNTAQSSAVMLLSCAGTTARQACTTYQVSGTYYWIEGILATDGTFRIAPSNTGVDISTSLQISQAGEMTLPLQPAFLAYQASAASNVTGNGTSYTLGTTVDLTESFDQNSDFDATTGTFTAPVTGKYCLSMSAYINGTTIATAFIAQIATSNQTFTTQIIRSAVSADQNAPLTIFCDMDASDTATFIVASSGEAADTDDVYGQAASPRYTWCSGYLVC